MANVQLNATLVANTGNGALMVPYRMAGDIALYTESAPVATAAQMQLKRTDPKPTKDYAGASKGELRFTRWYADATGRLWPAIVTVSSSIPDFRTNAEKIAFVTEALIASQSAEAQSNLATRAVPQS